MPTYDHVCSHCNHEWEDFYKMNDPVPSVCPSCKTDGSVKRLISAVIGSVSLEGRDLISSLKNQGKAMSRDIARSESKVSDFFGI